MAEKTKPRERTFTFTPLFEKKCQFLEHKDNLELLMKWALKDRMSVHYYNFDKMFQVYQKEDFFLDFMQDPNVVSSLPVCSDKGSWGTTGMVAAKIEALPIPSTVLSMTFFDRLSTVGIVRESGSIVKCFDEYVDDFVISDELRKVLLVEDSEHYETFSEDDRNQLLFRIFKHLALGGSVCQYEDTIQPYLDMTKLLYKELISVQKDPDSKQLNILSHIFSLKAWDKDNFQYYPAEEDHEQTFSYVIVDPLKRQVAVLYNRFGCGVFN